MCMHTHMNTCELERGLRSCKTGLMCKQKQGILEEETLMGSGGRVIKERYVWCRVSSN